MTGHEVERALPFLIRSDEGILLVDDKRGGGLRPATYAEEALAAALSAAQDALRYYADERLYKSQPTPDAERGHYPTYVPVLKDRGKKARAALAPADTETWRYTSEPSRGTYLPGIASADTETGDTSEGVADHSVSLLPPDVLGGNRPDDTETP